jgi:hypothetical protein
MRCAQMCACKTAMELQLPFVPLNDGVFVTTAKNMLLHITVQLLEAVTGSFCTAGPEGKVTLLIKGGACQKLFCVFMLVLLSGTRALHHYFQYAPFSAERQEVSAHKVHPKMQHSVHL